MQVQQVHNINISETSFGKRFISKDSKITLQKITKKMEKESFRPNADNNFDAKVLWKAAFRDGTGIGRPSETESLIAVGNKRGFFVNNETGEILGFLKPFYVRKKKMVEKGQRVIRNINDNYGNKGVVTKQWMQFPTKEEYQAFMNQLKGVQEALGNVIKKGP